MTAANLGIVIGPSIFRSAEESVAAIMDIKFAGVVVQLMVENCDRFFPDPPVSVIGNMPSSSESFSGPVNLRGIRSQSIDGATLSPTAASGDSVAGGREATGGGGSGGGSGGGIGNFLTRQLSSKLRRSVR